jgi:drug/metabolite transporter (DMT)-like permease
MASNALDAWDITALRFGVGGLVLLPLFARRGLGVLGPLRGLFLAVGAGAPYVLLTAGGLAFAPAAHMGVITPSCMLLCSTLGGAWILREPLTSTRMLGAAAITAGLVAMGWDGLANHGELTLLGDAMFALGGLFWASYTIASRRWSVDPLHATTVVGVLSMVLYVPGYAWLAGDGIVAAPWRDAWLPSSGSTAKMGRACFRSGSPAPTCRRICMRSYSLSPYPTNNSGFDPNRISMFCRKPGPPGSARETYQS